MLTQQPRNLINSFVEPRPNQMIIISRSVSAAGSGQVSSLSLVLMDFLIVVVQQSSEVVFLGVWTFMQRHSAEETLLFNPRDFAPRSLCFSMCSLCLCQCETMWECPNGPSTASGPREWVGLLRIYSFPHSRALTGPPLISLEWSGSDILQQWSKIKTCWLSWSVEWKPRSRAGPGQSITHSASPR